MMKALLQQKTRIALLASVLLACSTFWLAQTGSALSCQTSFECSKPFNWLSWLQGQSRSSQFHFVDLLELLDRMLSVNNDKQ